jgi:hypothetical protein
MDWREAAAGGLPAPRNDEPASLRQNILDELADHLDCALKRELTKNITPEEAVENVKRSFGEPRDLARRLWLDAMKDSIMSKRLTLAAMGLMTLTCLLLVLFAWRALVATQQAALHAQAASERLMVALAARPAPAGNAATERVPVRFHLICDDAQKSPANGYEGTLTVAKSRSLVNALRRVSDANGELDFGMLPLGSYSIGLSTPWHETARFEFDASPGFPIASAVVCPARDWLPADVSFKLIGLPSLKDRDALIVCTLTSEIGRRVGGPLVWTRASAADAPQNQKWMDSYHVVLDQSGRVIYLGDVSQSVGRQQPGQYTLALGGEGSSNYFQLFTPTDEFSWLVDGLKHPTDLKFLDRKYVLQSIAVVLASDIQMHLGVGGARSQASQTLLTWKPDWTPVVEESQAFRVKPSLHPVVGRDNVFEVPLTADFAERVDKMLVSSASRVPESTNATEAKTDAAAGAELLKTLGIESASADQSPAGLGGLRLKSVRDKSLAHRAYLKSDDLLVGLQGWNVRNDRELGWASRADRPTLHRDFLTGISRSLIPQGALLVLVLRGTEWLLYEIPPPGSPIPDSATPSKATSPAKASAEGRFPGRRLRDRRPVPIPE